MKPGGGHEERLSARQTHGVKALKRAVSTLGSRTIDRRTGVGKALAAWRSDLLADLGGLEAVSTQELALIDEAVKTKLILDSVDAWLLSQATLINKRTRAVLPAVRDRNALVSTLRGLLGDLGLRRRTQEAPDLGSYLAERYGAGNGRGVSQEGRGTSPEAPCVSNAIAERTDGTDSQAASEGVAAVGEQRDGE